MAGSKVPTDANMTSEVRAFLDSQARTADQTAADLADAIAALPALASQAEAEAGVNNVTYTSPLRVAQAITALSPNSFTKLLHVEDQKAANTAGGTFTAGADQTRTLNTSVSNAISGASLASNQITLPAGTYYIDASAPGVLCGVHRAWLYNTTATATTRLGTSETSNTSGNMSLRSRITGLFTLSVSSVLEIRHRCSSTSATNGFGLPANFNSEVEIYTTAMFWRVG